MSTTSSMRRPSGLSPNRPCKKETEAAMVSPGEKDLLVLSTAIKLLLFPAYRSTDFEVHRNWLAVTHQLPISRWYFDTTSEWTLDYPPFFAHFEHSLSHLAQLFDPAIVQLSQLGYASPATIMFQRGSVVVTELLVLGSVLWKYVRTSKDPATQLVISASLFLHPGFLIVDHIHFQYNGVMYGILIWSMWHAKQGNHLACGALFAILLNFKHIYMYLAPPYFIYLLRSYCFPPSTNILSLPRLATLGSLVLSIFLLSLAPFLNQLPQLASRLFPFTRGLNHAYWAPNFWALVTVVDRGLLKYGEKVLGFTLDVAKEGVESSTRGFVGDTVFAVLPNIKPGHCFAITVALQALFLVKLWKRPTYKVFVWALTLSGFTSFLFGWHVHEKAVLLVLVPLSFLASESYAFFRIFTIASVAGIVSLFPLLFTPSETPIKLAYTLLWCLLTFSSLSRVVYRPPPTPLSSLLIHPLESVYLYLFPFLQLFVSVLHPLALAQGKTWAGGEFLPLMATSVYCAVGLVWCWGRLVWEGTVGEWQGWEEEGGD
ncbi:glycosyltransferase family 57 protein [Mrakia frigida]|uniref:dolichyl-P-Glc:Glc1Man(9)GlcNAc(2)-PP-dolichol alpha-1,3-glucosyltransferase n=1 Tax=Mrakia frigida TaxID=29902 RepID=UPI003FCC0D3D